MESSTIKDKLEAVKYAQSEIKRAIEETGVEVGIIPFVEYADKIREIYAGFGHEVINLSWESSQVSIGDEDFSSGKVRTEVTIKATSPVREVVKMGFSVGTGSAVPTLQIGQTEATATADGGNVVVLKSVSAGGKTMETGGSVYDGGSLTTFFADYVWGAGAHV